MSMSKEKEVRNDNGEAISKRQIELNTIQKKILEAIRVSRKYWMIYKEGTFGISTILNLIYKKSYVEVLFFTNRDVLDKGMPLLKIYTPIETEIDINQIILNPDFDDDGLVSPLKIINRLSKTINSEYRFHLSVLEQEVTLLNEDYENYSVENNPYNREIWVYFPHFLLKLKINFENYPLLPKITFSLTLSRIIKLNEFLKTENIKKWDENHPLHVTEIVNSLIKVILDRLNISGFFKDSQHLIMEDIMLSDKIKNLNFKVHRGESLGIYYDSTQISEHIFNLELLKLMRALGGSQEDFNGTIKVFGKHVQLLSEQEKKRIFILPARVDEKTENLTLARAIKKGIQVANPFKERRVALTDAIKHAGLYQLKDEIYEEFEKRIQLYRILRNWKEKRDNLSIILKVTGLILKKDVKVKELTSLEYMIFSVARALLQYSTLIIFRIPPDFLNRMEYAKFNEFIKNIKKSFHMIFILYGPEEIVSECDEILIITEKATETRSIEEYRAKLPQSGELVLIELNNPNPEEINKLRTFESLVIIEDRKNERYKIYTQMNPDDLLILLIQIFGQNLYSFKRLNADLDDYLEYIHQNLKSIGK